MTIIESFEKAPIDNIISALETRADKIIFLGKKKQMEQSISIYKKLLTAKGIYTDIVMKEIQSNNLDHILDVLTQIVENETDCIFDITGGEDLVLLGFGIIYERYKNTKSIQLQRFDVCTEDYPLDVKELISLYGGVVMPEDPQPMVTNAMEEVDKLWALARTDSSGWNRSISYLKEFENKYNRALDDLEMSWNLKDPKVRVDQYDLKHREVVKLLNEFSHANLILDLKVRPDVISYRYKNAFVKRCLEKAGDALEMKTYFEALTLTEHGKPYFNDCYVSVNIDWDGMIHPLRENWKDTTNEIDLILMRGVTPIFISCKHGKIGEEELYKLNTVASRFGGKYAKKMLIATKLERESPTSKKAYMQRAKDMGIFLVPNAGQLTKQEWKELLKNI